MTMLANSTHTPPLRLVPSRTGDVLVRGERMSDIAARERLLDDAFGPARFAKTCQRLRDGQAPARGLSFVASDGGRVLGTLRFWNIQAGDRPALLLGPLAVAVSHRGAGIGGRLLCAGLERASLLGHRAVLLVGDAPYYERFGFERRFTRQLIMPGEVDGKRFLGRELVAGALAGARGRVAVPCARSGRFQEAA